MRILFHRNFKNFTGGHLKVWHYYTHVCATSGFEAGVYLTPGSTRTEANPWVKEKCRIDERYDYQKSDILFVAGMDWIALPEDEKSLRKLRIINLVQHVRHAELGSQLRSYLSRPALRICVSSEVEEAILSTGEVNGEVVTIPNGTDLDEFFLRSSDKEIKSGTIIVALKNPGLGKALYEQLKPKIPVLLLSNGMNRENFLKILGQAKVAIFLPNPTEGFYLPALEAMALRTAVVCPDVVGNRAFCMHNRTCLLPDYNTESLAAAALRLASEPDTRSRLVKSASLIASKYSLTAERAAFQRILLEKYS